ncbi:hypothetical protein P8625_14105 [Tenacibaculum tangerinum]|uniref:Lacal_2735 family protein n=1 Tax=Tenacibaculum tangerinum TaxID=3038772 RepID=A0ABY8L1F0_9FLAO|nr:hypothetical protein [Tenacibaculum tangerinum]WGH75190.1 hypothetical protein P8625_14105 [Tenacibaculum tangerinum]
MVSHSNNYVYLYGRLTKFNMSRINQLRKYKKHLEERYRSLVETANDYKYEDECKSDRSAFKAMKILEKLNRIKYLDEDVSNTVM